MKVNIIYPAKAHSAYKIAAEIFAKLAYSVASVECDLVSDDEYLAGKECDGLCAVIGSDAVNRVTSELYLALKIDGFGIKYCTDSYCIRGCEVDGRSFLFLAGGRPRSTIYAVYRYFEKFCGCRWFWDGDRICKGDLPVLDVELCESPKFEYRGLRYFAHRSLHRFQAEHWSFEDWCCEIDWVLKKRLNIFMLRIGMDDIFQKAFPEAVSYPDRDKTLPEAGVGYDDRTLFWSLEYRGELRKRILTYAFERDLMHPEDCGTMSHWYSRTPKEFLEKINPTLLPQSNKHYNDPTGRVWDIRERENFENYFKLTKAHVDNYGRPEIFHTIGLGERLFSLDKEINKRMKLFVYRKIATQISESYPGVPLLIASWDLWMHFSPEEVRELVSELDPKTAIIFDYTSDTARENNFTKWGVVNKFPWIFGIFSGYEPESEIRGFYSLTNERLKIAKSDPMCKGVVLWPELAHGDPFVIEYFAQNSWDGESEPVEETLKRYCADRYPAEIAKEMSGIWQKLMPIVELTSWSIDESCDHHGSDIFVRPLRRIKFDAALVEKYRENFEKIDALRENAVDILKRIRSIPTDDEMTRRDLYDIARTVIGRFINAAILRVECLYIDKAPLKELEVAMEQCVELVASLADLLSSHSDYSLYESLKMLKSVTQVNPNFEHTLKNNAENGYCRAYIYENAEYLYLPEIKEMFAEVIRAAKEGSNIDFNAISARLANIRNEFFNLPLASMKKQEIPYHSSITRAINAMWS